MIICWVDHTIPNVMRLNRWFMHDVTDRLANQGFNSYIDLATGLPTEGYLHELAPHARILYNDLDPTTVAYGREILGNNPNVFYDHQDIRSIEGVLAKADTWLNGERHVGVMFVGVAYFLNDDEVRHILQALYQWCAPGSQLAISWILGDMAVPAMKATVELYARMGTAIHVRTAETVSQLVSDWQVLEPGLLPLLDWLKTDGLDLPAGYDSSQGEIVGMMLQRP